jgi:hypothetical protein
MILGKNQKILRGFIDKIRRGFRWGTGLDRSSGAEGNRLGRGETAAPPCLGRRAAFSEVFGGGSDNLAVTAEVMEFFAGGGKFAEKLQKIGGIDRGVEVEIEHEFKLAFRNRTAFQLD